MKVIINLNSAWAAYNFRVTLAKEIRSQNIEVVFLIPDDGNYFNKISKEFKCVEIKIDPQSINPFKDFVYLLKLYLNFLHEKPDLILSFSIKANIFGNLAARALKIPVINNINGLGTTFIRKNLLTAIVKKLYKISLASSQMVFLQNSHDLLLFKELKFIKENFYSLVPGSGVNILKFAKKNVSRAHKEFTFLFLGRIIRDKGVEEIIGSIKLLRSLNFNFRFNFVGEVDSKNRTSISRNQVEEWEKSNLITFYPMTDDVRKHINMCDCLVLPSYREGLPRVILEAFSMEKTVIASRVPGCIDIVSHNIDGFICEPYSVDDLANQMINMLNLKPKDIEKMGKKGREKILKFYDEKIVLKKYISQINHILK